MLGAVVTVLISWALLRWLTGESLNALGLSPSKQRLKELLFGLLFMAMIAVINFTWQAHFKTISYQLNPDYGLMKFLGGSLWVFNAVLFEELVFRGCLLLLLIRYLGIIRACLLSSVAFGIYHWFSYELFGSRLILLIYIFLVTGAGGWMFAYAFAKTKSLYAPVGLHLGWNMVTAMVFSAGPIGHQLLIPHGETAYSSEWVTLLFFALQTIVAPGLVTWYLYRIYPSVESRNSSSLQQSTKT
ncbi:CPBP family intramembrane glutamic endopeptidase [Marinicella sediminis]|uniref:CPBP family intramembrane glutamic endopeptidase n=1 Tax=Marinicella sediminis TaxID=1792834 RepID=A0ABV7JDB1_9GAMM|nr:CPBP family intramembrane glutamic endopeptidase [Marinicella sediminis]